MFLAPTHAITLALWHIYAYKPVFEFICRNQKAAIGPGIDEASICTLKWGYRIAAVVKTD
jgi:hypothetical protein